MDQNQIQARIRYEIVASYPGVFNFSREEVAQIVGCSVGYLANLESQGHPLLPSVKLGKKRLYQLPDIVDFLVRQKGISSPRRHGPRTKVERITKVGADGRLISGGR